MSNALRWIILITLGLVLYGQTLFYPFVFDDHIFITGNPFIKRFENIHLLWQNFPITRLVGFYSFAFNYWLNQLNPFGYHLFNICVHLLTTGLVWAVADTLFRITHPGKSNKHLPFFIALLFLVHPGQTQAVTYISQRFESMAALFYFSTVFFYLQARITAQKPRQFILFALACAFAVIALLTKETAVTLPAMILAVEYLLWPKRINKPIILALFSGIFLLLFFKFIGTDPRILAHTHISESHDGDILTPSNYFLTQPRVFLTFLRLLVFPAYQNLDYDFPMSTGLLSPFSTLAGVMLTIFIIYLIFKLHKTMPLAAFGLAWMLICFSINLAPRRNVIFEHKLYLISFGFFLSFITILAELIKSKSSLNKLLVCIVITLSVICFIRNQVWRNELTLWEDIVQKSPNKSRVNANLGRVYGSLKRYREAIVYLDKAIALEPKDDISIMNRGSMYYELGDTKKALQNFDQALSINPSYASVYVNRALIFMAEGGNEQSLNDLNRAVELEPLSTDGYSVRGILYARMKQYKEALNDFESVLRIAPYDQDALNNRAKILSIYQSTGK